MGRKRKISKIAPRNVLAFVLKEERRSSILILAAAVTALVLANSKWSSLYFSFLHQQLTLGAVTFDIQHWINEGLMAIFFLVVVLEIKREFIDGELRSWKKASFLVFSAIGGMVIPALIFSALNPYPPESTGWAIPMSTDTAIALGVIGLLGRKIPRNLKIFLLAVAIIDDIISITVIGLYYSRPSNMFFLFLAIALSILLIYARSKKFRIVSFAVIGFAIWYSLLMAGVTGTIAGVIVALIAPLTTRRSNAPNLQGSEIVEDMLLPVTALLIVPLFVFANAGLDFSKISLSHGDGLMIYIGVALGLLIGKPVGILAGGWIAASLRIAHKPRGVNWSQILGVGFISGIGFTIAILIADLAYKTNPDFQNAAILGVFTASILSAFVGLLILRYSSRTPATKK
jgi:Na+:H+ antiporter, NhaA family